MEKMNIRLQRQVNLLIKRYPILESVEQNIIDAYLVMQESYENGGKLLIAGNGGSAADSEHIVGELMKGFKLPRKTNDKYANKLIETEPELGKVLAENLQMALPAIALDGHMALSTAYMNDCEPLLCFAQQVNGFGKEGDVFLGISTSGNSKNILYAATVAKAKGMKIVGLTGQNDSKLSAIADVTVKAPNMETYMIQELHLPIYHCWCLMLEDYFFGRKTKSNEKFKEKTGDIICNAKASISSIVWKKNFFISLLSHFIRRIGVSVSSCSILGRWR